MKYISGKRSKMPADLDTEKEIYVEMLRRLATQIETEEIAVPTGLCVLGLCVNGTYLRAYNYGPDAEPFRLIGVLEREKQNLLERCV